MDSPTSAAAAAASTSAPSAASPSSPSASAAVDQAAQAADASASGNIDRLFEEVEDEDSAADVEYDEDELLMDELPPAWLVDTPPADLLCAICDGVIWHAPNLPCGHVMCRRCVDHLSNAACVKCSTPFDRAHLQTIAYLQLHVLAQLPVKCRQHDAGCEWSGELGIDGCNLNKHDTECPFKAVACKACKQTVMRRDFEAHQQTQCFERTVRCASCQEQMPRSSIDAHFNLSPHAASIQEHSSMDDGTATASASATEPAVSGEEKAAEPCADAEQEENPSWHQVGSPDLHSPTASSRAASSPMSPLPNGASDVSSDDLALLPPFVPPCVNSEACPLGCEDPAHPGHVLSIRTSQRSAHQSACPQRPVVCHVCQPPHSVPDCRFVAHVDALMSAPAVRSTTAAQVAELCKTAEQVQQELQQARAEAAATKQQLQVQTAELQKQQQSAAEAQQQSQTQVACLQEQLVQQQQQQQLTQQQLKTAADKQLQARQQLQAQATQLQQQMQQQQQSAMEKEKQQQAQIMELQRQHAEQQERSRKQEARTKQLEQDHNQLQQSLQQCPQLTAKFGETLKEGDQCDYIDATGKWHLVVVAATDFCPMVKHLEGPNKGLHPMFLSRAVIDGRLQPPRSHTSGITDP